MSDITIEQLKAENEALKAELKAVKTERTTAKTEATKANNKLAEVQTELDNLKAQLGEGSSDVSLKEENEALKLENQAQAETIAKLQGEKTRKQNEEMTDDELKAKALKVMEQKELQEAYITTKKGFVFDKEDSARSNSRGAYKIAQMVDGKVVLKNPAK